MRRVPLAIALAGAVVLALLAGVVLLGNRSAAQSFDLVGVSAEDLESSGIVLKRPMSDNLASVDEKYASKVARGKHAPGATVRQVVLAREVDVEDLQAERLVWVVNFEPDSIVPAPPSGGGLLSTDPKDIRVKFALVFVDATTGEWLFSLEESRSVPVKN